MRLLARLFAGFGILLLLAARPAFAEPHAPAVWKIHDADSTVYLLGTIHLLKADTPWLSEDLRAIAERADTLTLELHPDEATSPKMQQRVMQLGFYPPSDGLSQHVPDPLYQRLAAEFQELGIPVQAMERMKPWMVGIQIGVVSAMRAGFLPQYGVDHTLGQLAAASGKTIRGLETAEYQLSLFADLSDEAQIAFLEEGMEQVDDLAGYFAKLKDAWLSADLEDLDALLREGMDKSPELAEALLFTRNANWIPEIEALLDEPGEHLVAVGAAHLTGTKSVIDLLAQKGYAPERF